MIQLFIENEEIEITESVQIAITKQFEELSNPTTIINDWSKTVSIPFTEKNNRIFGHIYNLDKLIVSGGGTVGMYFDPLQKLDFRIVWNSDVLITGYAKMNKIKQNGLKGTYEITLFGQLGKIFQEMKKITFDTSEQSPYLIDGSQYVSEYISKNLIYSSWVSSGQSSSTLKKKTDTGYIFTDIIGFAPNNSFSEGLNYDSFQTEPMSSKTFKDVLGEPFTEATGVQPDTVIPNGLLPREIGEYRSYLQLPFIYFNKLFQVFKQKAEDITGYTFDLDSEWFNTLNPYWYKLVYMLKPFNAKNGNMTENANTYLTNPYSGMGWQHSSMYNTMTTHRTTNLCTYQNSYTEQVPMIDSSVYFNDGKWFTLDDTTISPIFKIHSIWEIYDEDGSSSSSKLNNNNALVIKVNAVGENGTTNSIKFLVKSSECTITETGAQTIIFDGSTKAGSTDKFTIDANFLINKKTYGNSVRFRYEAYWKNSNWCLTSNGDMVQLSPYKVNNPNHTNVTILSGAYRSFAHFTLNDLWNKDYNLFNEILKYCKMYRICISLDEINKKIKFMPYSKFFSSYSVVDWKNKVDKSKDFDITPITLENKYVLFNYEDSKTKLGEEYKEKYGVNYGEYRLVTEYKFNEETEKLFDKITPSITNTDNVLSWTNIYDNHKIVYSFPAEISVYNKDKDKKQVDLFGAYFFHKGITAFSSESSLYMRTVKISDDTAFQQGNNVYIYTQDADTTLTALTYPFLDIVYDNYMCVFNVPKENYTYLNNYSGKRTIYTNFWQNYINERYNVQNKLVTCNIDLRPEDYRQFDYNKFVKVDNQLCMVNKIYDYDVTNDNTTKVDLVTIQDIAGYADDSYMRELDTLKLSWSSMIYLNGTEGATVTLGTFTSISNVTFDNNTKNKTVNGVQFYINDYNHTIEAYNVSAYVDEPDVEFSITVKNQYSTASFNVTRYSVYPYPYINLTKNGSTITTLSAGNNGCEIVWERTNTNDEQQGNEPYVQVTGSGYFVTPSHWICEDAMYQIGDDEYFMYKWRGQLDLDNLTAGNTITITVTDEMGWHQTKTYNVV